MSTETQVRDTVFIGKKPLMAYVTTTLIQLANLSSVYIKARGMSIGRAVDVAQIISRKTENAGFAIGTIKISSEIIRVQRRKTKKRVNNRNRSQAKHSITILYLNFFILFSF